MKIIFLQDVRGIGKKFDVKEVSDGYARNFLFPNKLAEQANNVSLKKIEEMKAAHEHSEVELMKQLEDAKRQIEAVTLEFPLKADKSGAPFASVNKEMILSALRDHRFITTERVGIDLKYPVKEFGLHTVEIDLKKGVVAKLKISVVKGE
jgi:large subunit ribosomal protein L9